MLPQVTQLLSLRAGPDARVVGARFRDAQGDEVALVLPSLGGAAIGYGPPELRRSIAHPYSSKIDGQQLAYYTREDTPLSWEDAVLLLAQIAPLVAETDAPDFSRLQHAVASRGAPARIPPTEPTPDA